MANETGDSRSVPKRRRTSVPSDPEPPRPINSSSRLDSTIETIPRRTVRLRADAEEAYSSLELQATIILLENHKGQGTTPPSRKIKKIQAKGHNFDELPEATFDDIVREAEMKLLEASIDHSALK